MADEMKSLNAEQLDAIGEVMNISMGAAATAVSSMLEKQVTITTPRIDQERFSNINVEKFEPAIIIKIKYNEGISGTNVIVLRKRDMKIILDLLMGNDYTQNTDDIEFDEMSMSAACEVMNQMMGASATALSEILNRTVSISTPEAQVVDTLEKAEKAWFGDVQDSDNIVSIGFNMSISEVLDTTFCSFFTMQLAGEIVNNVSAPAPEPVKAEVTPESEKAAEITKNEPYEEMKAKMAPQAPPVMPQAPVTQQMPMQAPIQQQMPTQMPMQPRPAEVTYVAEQSATRQQVAPVSISAAAFPEFTKGVVHPQVETNLELLMGVQLDVSVVIGTTKRKIREIADFGQGSVLELNKQTGAPADIVVNGQLIAHGDVIVVGDSFGVRITDIVGTKELMDSLESNM